MLHTALTIFKFIEYTTTNRKFIEYATVIVSL